MPILNATRDALVTYINGLNLTPSLTAIAAYEDVAGLEELAAGRMLVINNRPSAELLTFDNAEEKKPQIDVVIQYKAATLMPAESDPYISLSESIAEQLLGATLSNGVQCIEADWPEGAIIFGDLESYQVISVRLTLTFYLVE